MKTPKPYSTPKPSLKEQLGYKWRCYTYQRFHRKRAKLIKKALDAGIFGLHSWYITEFYEKVLATHLEIANRDDAFKLNKTTSQDEHPRLS